MPSLRELNRTTLARQLLLQRSTVSVTGLLERLTGLQAQVARPPFVGVWTRLDGFTRDDLAGPIEQRTIVKATFLRGTLHLLTARDYVRYRATLQPVLASAVAAIVKQRGATVDAPRLVEAASEFLRESPRSFAEITMFLTRLLPDSDPRAMRYAVRMHLPIVQVPTRTAWCYPGNPKFALAEDWLGSPLLAEEHAADLVKRYLAAFGPATVADMQTWSYLPNLQGVFEQLRDELVCYRPERGRELFDLPELALEAADIPAPVRFLPEFDNLLMAHQDRARLVPKAYRSRVYLPGLRLAATVLIDGFVAGVWTTRRTKQLATLVINPFEAPSRPAVAALEAEGERLLRFVEPDASSFAVRIEEGDGTASTRRGLTFASPTADLR